MFSSGALTEPPKFPVWQPLTFSGVADFARARWARLLLVQGLLAAFLVAAGLLFLGRCWFPVVTQATKDLTEFGTLKNARLAWPKSAALVLAENRFLGFVVDLEETGAAGRISDVQVVFARDRMHFISLLGPAYLPYPAGVEIDVSHPVLDPWWNAWRSAFYFGAGFAGALYLAVSWLALATLYTLPVRLLAWLAGRATSLGKCWRIAGAALLPGALWLGVALLLYAGAQLSLLGLLVAFALHFVVAWIYLIAAPFYLPRKSADPLADGANPFNSRAAAAEPAAPAAPPAR